MKARHTFLQLMVLVTLLLQSQDVFSFYNPSTGKWINRDPIEEAGGENLYGVVRNAPVIEIDILGEIGVPVWVEKEFKETGYQFWRANFVTAPQWRYMMDNWYNERGSNPAVVTGSSDPRNHDIANNTGFVKLLNCWIAKKRGDKVATSSEWKVESDHFWWHYGYWGFLGFGNGAGGQCCVRQCHALSWELYCECSVCWGKWSPRNL